VYGRILDFAAVFVLLVDKNSGYFSHVVGGLTLTKCGNRGPSFALMPSWLGRLMSELTRCERPFRDAPNTDVAQPIPRFNLIRYHWRTRWSVVMLTVSRHSSNVLLYIF